MEIITREEAIKIGQPWFFTGKPCKCGHIDKINVKRWACYECSRIIKKKYRDNNKDKIREQKKESYKRNFKTIALKAKQRYPEIKEERQIYLKEYYQKNKQKLISKASIYFQDNIEKVKAYKRKWNKTESGILSSKNSKANRRSLEKRLGVLKKSELTNLLQQEHDCYWCGKKIDKTLSSSYHFDHYVPLSKGGANTIDNIKLSCAKCNLTKSAKSPYVFAIEKGKLF